MSNKTSRAKHSDLEKWFVAKGFVKGNPFATLEADQERALLPEFFVDGGTYDRIKTDHTVIVSAPRGGGKSALRVVLSSLAAPISPGAHRLAIEYTDFHVLVGKLLRGRRITVEDHVSALLREGVCALLNTLCGFSPEELTNQGGTREREICSAHAASFPAHARSRLARMLREYSPASLSPEHLHARLQTLDPTFSTNWYDFVEAIESHRLRAMVQSSPLRDDSIADLLCDLNDYPDTQAGLGRKRETTPKGRISSLVSLAREMNMKTVWILVDRLDEIEETADDPEMQVSILQPLLADLPIMEAPGTAFKFFLPQETSDLLFSASRPKLRSDRLEEIVVPVSWSQDHLRHILEERLTFFSDGLHHDLTELCNDLQVPSDDRRPPQTLAKWMEDEMLLISQGSPRRLLFAVGQLFQAHVNGGQPDGRLEQEDWETAKTAVLRRMPPTLQVARHERTALVGERNIELSPQEHKILLALIDAGGYYDRESLVDKVWGGPAGVTNEAVDQAMHRLRMKLEDDSKAPIYLRTVRKGGFRLSLYTEAK